MPTRIAFYRKNRWPAANRSSVEALRFAFPKADIIEIDLVDYVRSRPGLMALNGLWIAKQYAGDLLLKRRSVRESFWITSFMFQHIRQVANKISAQVEADCSFQMQSLFDASSPTIPHYVYTDHTVLANQHYPGFQASHLYARAWMRREQDIYQNARIVFTRSQNISASLMHDYNCPAHKIACVHVGCNVPLIHTKKHAPKQQNVLFVGIDWERKGGSDLMEAWRMVVAEYPQATLHIVGCQPQITAPNCYAYGRLGLDETSQFFHHATIFCLPTRREPFGVAVLEALAHSIPVITTNIGALPELVEHGRSGWLVEPGSPAQLAWRLKQLLANHDQRLAFGEAGAKRVAAFYTWRYVGEQFRRYID